MAAVQETIEQVKEIDVDQYKYGFETEIESVKAPKGLDEDDRPLHLGQEGRAGVDARTGGSRPSQRWQAMTEPTWAKVHYPKIDFQDLYYYSAPKIDGRPEEPRRGRSGAAARPTTSSASR